jgi:hypothetical protein
MKTKLLFIGLLATTSIFTSCKKDKENPTITVSTPDEHSEHLWGATVHLNANFSDDQGLKNYTVMVTDADGNHDHDFDFMTSGDISGKSYDFHEHFVVPDSAMTMRWVTFSVTDAEDKNTTLSWMLHFAE